MDFGTIIALFSISFVVALITDLYISGLYYEPVRVQLIILASMIGLVSHLMSRNLIRF